MANIYIQKLLSLNTNNTSALYTITNNSVLQIQDASPLSPMPIPQTQAELNQLIKVSGNSRQITESWTVVDLNSNNSTPNSANSGFIAVSASDSFLPLTAWEQNKFLENFILPVGIADAYQFTIADSCTLGSITKPVSTDVTTWYYNPIFTNVYYQNPGSLTDMSFSMSGNTPVTFSANITMMIGKVIGALELNTPSYPLGFSAVQGSSSGQINLSWSAPTDLAGGLSSKNPPYPYVIFRKTAKTYYSTTPDINATTTYTSGSPLVDTGLVSGTTYYYTIYAQNANGLGEPAPEVSAAAK